MTFKKALSIFTCNFTNVYKLLVYVIICGFVAAILSMLLYIPTLKPLILSIRATGLYDNILLALRQFFSADATYTETITAVGLNIDKVSVLIESNRGKLNLAYILFLVITALFRFFLYAGNYVAADLINKSMHSNMKYNFGNSFIDNMKEASMFSLLSTLINFPIDLLIGYSAYGFFLLSVSWLRFFTPSITLLLVVILLSVKLTFLTSFVPAMQVDNMRASKALVYSFKDGLKHFGNYVCRYVILLFLMIGVSLGISVFTLGVALIAVIPSFPLFIVIDQTVLYYDNHHLSYYISPYEVYKPLVRDY